MAVAMARCWLLFRPSKLPNTPFASLRHFLLLHAREDTWPRYLCIKARMDGREGEARPSPSLGAFWQIGAQAGLPQTMWGTHSSPTTPLYAGTKTCWNGQKGGEGYYLAQPGGVVASWAASGLPRTMWRTRSSPMRKEPNRCPGWTALRPSTSFTTAAFSEAAQGLSRLKMACMTNASHCMACVLQSGGVYPRCTFTPTAISAAVQGLFRLNMAYMPGGPHRLTYSLLSKISHSQELRVWEMISVPLLSSAIGHAPGE